MKNLYIESLKLQTMDNYLITKYKKQCFKSLLYNYKLNKYLKQKQYTTLHTLFLVLKNYSVINMTNKLKKISLNSKVNSFRKTKLKYKIKKYLSNFKKVLEIRTNKSIFFRDVFLKIKIYKLLYNFNKKSKKGNNDIVAKFTQFRHKTYIFSILKQFYIVIKRENYILSSLRKIYKDKKYNLIKTCIEDWKKFYVCQKFRKAKLYQIIMKFFIVLKVTSKKHIG